MVTIMALLSLGNLSAAAAQGFGYNVQPPAIDHFARWSSGIGIVIAIAGLILALHSKYSEWKEKRDAKEPTINVVVQNIAPDYWQVHTVVRNKSDFSVRLGTFEVSEGFSFTSGSGQEIGRLENWSHKLIEPEDKAAISGELRRQDGSKVVVIFALNITIYSPNVRDKKISVKRLL